MRDMPEENPSLIRGVHARPFLPNEPILGSVLLSGISLSTGFSAC